MKIMILANSSSGFLTSHYGGDFIPKGYSYTDLEKYRIDTYYHPVDFYAHNLRLLGCDIQVVVINDFYLQSAWSRENSFKHSNQNKYTLILRKKIIPWIRKMSSRNWVYEILREQIKSFKPDVIYNSAVLAVDHTFLSEIKSSNSVIVVGQHAAMLLDAEKDWSCYDLIISSFQPTIQWLTDKGIRSAFVRLGFEPYVLDELEVPQKYDITFVGAFHEIHRSRQELIEKLCNFFDVHIWSPYLNVDKSSPLWRNYHGAVYGKEMYKILASSKITLNHHGDVLPYANNLRLYEATGVGTFLITDFKENLSEIFDLGKEVVAYHSPEECIRLLNHYLAKENEREIIAKAGQQRTLNEHTYYQRMMEVVDEIEKLL